MSAGFAMLGDLPAGVVNRFLLIRHGEPSAAGRGRCCGRLDIGLSDRGRAQVARLAASLPPRAAAAVYSSPLVRASESAQILATALRVPLEVDDRLAEIDFGALDGLTFEEIERDHPKIYRRWMETPGEVEFPGGESYAALRERVDAATADIRARQSGQVVALVTHAGVLRAILAGALGIPAANIFRLEQSPAALSCVDYYPDTPVVRFVNARAG